MNKTILAMCMATMWVSMSFASVIYVRSGQTGNGTSWKSPIGNLNKALERARPGTEIWVARGTYFPSNCKRCTKEERNKFFLIPDGVQLYGGFIGNEKSFDERDPVANPTVLSGHLGYDDWLDNSHTVVGFKNVTQSTVLDGFIITGGYAEDIESNKGDPRQSGGGIYNLCTVPGGISNPTVRNCLFFENMAVDGGAVYNASGRGVAIIDMDDCKFVRNRASNIGGVLFEADNREGISSKFLNCKFVSNLSEFGNILFSESFAFKSDVFKDCRFTNNTPAVDSQDLTAQFKTDRNLNRRPGKKI